MSEPNVTYLKIAELPPAPPPVVQTFYARDTPAPATKPTTFIIAEPPEEKKLFKFTVLSCGFVHFVVAAGHSEALTALAGHMRMSVEGVRFGGEWEYRPDDVRILRRYMSVFDATGERPANPT